MTGELTLNQQVLLWDLALRGGNAFQKDVEYKEIAKDRRELQTRRFLTVSKKVQSLTLELTDNGWNELAKRRSILIKGKKKPGRERAILQLLIDALQNYASSNDVGLGEILRPQTGVPQANELRTKIRLAFFEIAGNPPQDSVRLSALRAKLNEIPRQQLNDALLAMKRAREINLMNLDNPRDVKAEESAALHDGNHQFHVLWIEQ